MTKIIVDCKLLMLLLLQHNAGAVHRTFDMAKHDLPML